MGGVICKREVLRHPIIILRGFGWRVFLRCLVARKGQTFLGILMQEGKL